MILTMSSLIPLVSPIIYYDTSVQSLLLYLGPFLPTGITIMRAFHNNMESIITLTWNLPPEDGGPAAVVDNYTLSIFSTSMLLPTTTISGVPFPPVNVTLSHNIMYNITIIATNCAGESELAYLANTHIGK